MPSYSYPSNPFLDSGIGFFANFLLRKQQVRDQQAAIDAERNRVVGEGIGRGFGNAFDVLAQDSVAARASDRQMQSMTAMQGAQYARQAALQQQRDQADLYQSGVGAYLKQYGELPPSSPDQMTPMPTGSPELDSFQAGSAAFFGQQEPNMTSATEPNMTPGVPLPTVSPAMTHEYKRLADQAAKRRMQYELLMMDPNRPADHKQAIAERMMPQIIRDQELLQKYPQPKQPTNFQELVQQGGVLPIPGTYNFAIPDPDGGYKISTAVHPQPQPGQSRMATTFEGKQIEIVPGNPVQLDDTTWYVEDAKGSPHFYSEKPAKDDGGLSPEDLLRMQKQMTTKDAKGNEREPPLSEVQRRYRDAKQLVEFEAYQEESGGEAGKALDLRGRELVVLSNRDEISLPMLDQWYDNVKQVYGEDKAKWPQNIRQTYEHLLQVRRDLSRNALMVE